MCLMTGVFSRREVPVMMKALEALSLDIASGKALMHPIKGSGYSEC